MSLDPRGKSEAAASLCNKLDFVTGPKVFKICQGLEIPLLGSYFRYIGF